MRGEAEQLTIKIKIMKEQFIPYEQALELKELGFDEKCFKSYRQQIKYEWYDLRSSENITFNENEKIILSNGKIDSYEKYLCDAPLWQQAFDWLWNKTGRYIIPIPNDDKEWLCMGNKFKTYEEARLECLKKLIKIVELEK